MVSIPGLTRTTTYQKFMYVISVKWQQNIVKFAAKITDLTNSIQTVWIQYKNSWLEYVENVGEDWKVTVTLTLLLHKQYENSR